MTRRDLLIELLENRESIRKITPTAREREVIFYVKQMGICYVADVAYQLQVNHRTASQLLRSSVDKGYLSRRNHYGPAGEPMYQYSYALTKTRLKTVDSEA